MAAIRFVQNRRHVIFKWEAMNRLHEEGLIEDPSSKAKSVVLTAHGLAEAERLFRVLFAKA